MNLSHLPAYEETISLFISYLGMKKVSYKTIKSHLAAVRHLHISSGLSFVGVSPRSHILIRGIKRTQGDVMVKLRLPITPSILGSIKVSLASTPLDYNNRFYWAAMCLGYFGFLRCREFTVPDGQTFDPSVHLARGDVVINSGLCPAGISVSYKTIKSYLAVVRHLHISSGLSFVGVSPHSDILIRGTKRTQGNVMVTIPDGQVFDPSVHLARGNVVINSGLCPAGISVNIKSSMTDPFRQEVALYLRQTGVDHCPVAAIIDYLAVRSIAYGPLFQFQDGSPLH